MCVLQLQGWKGIAGGVAFRKSRVGSHGSVTRLASYGMKTAFCTS